MEEGPRGGDFLPLTKADGPEGRGAVWARRPDRCELRRSERALAVTNTSVEETCLSFSIPTDSAQIFPIWLIIIASHPGPLDPVLPTPVSLAYRLPNPFSVAHVSSD